MAAAGLALPDMSLSPEDPRPGPPELRVGDREREQTVSTLRDAVAEGRITLAEFDERSSAAYAARTQTELDRLTSDLPVPGAARATPAPAPAARPPGVRDEAFVVAVMGGSERKGRWYPGRQITAFALMGGVDLDLREAVLEGGELAITAVAIMGGIDITVPPGTTVTSTGLAVMGGRAVHVGPPQPGAPRVHVAAWALMGGVDVKEKPLHPPKPPGRHEVHGSARRLTAYARPRPPGRRWTAPG